LSTEYIPWNILSRLCIRVGGRNCWYYYWSCCCCYD